MKVMIILFPHQIMNLPFHHNYQEGPIVNMETIEERLKEINLHKIYKKKKNYHLNNTKDIEQFNTKIGKQHYPRLHPHLWWQHVRLYMNILMTYLQL